MTLITKSGIRVIVGDFAKETNERKELGAKPEKTVINFRNDRIN